MKLSNTALQVLNALSTNPAGRYSGAEISSALGVASGTLYPMLIRFEKNGLVESEWEATSASELGRPRRRYYWITGAGIELSRREREKLDTPLSNVGVSGWAAG